jgi:hypothetical protein
MNENVEIKSTMNRKINRQFLSFNSKTIIKSEGIPNFDPFSHKRSQENP